MPSTTNESCQLIGGYDDHHNHAMFVLGIWQAVIAALVFLVTIVFGILNLRTSCVVGLGSRFNTFTDDDNRSPEEVMAWDLRPLYVASIQRKVKVNIHDADNIFVGLS